MIFFSIDNLASQAKNVVIATRGLQDRSTNIIAGTTVENKGKLILNGVDNLQKIELFRFCFGCRYKYYQRIFYSILNSKNN